MLTRRRLLVGGAGVGAAGLVAAGIGVEQRVLPGRGWLQAQLGLNGEDGVPPDVVPGPVEEFSFVSLARGRVRTGWSVIRPPGVTGPLPVVVALHGLGGSHATLTGPRYEIDRYLAASVAGGTPPFAVVAVDGGTSYWHPRPSGEDAGAMVLDELLPRVERHGLPVDRIGLLGWSMGGYGALRLAGLLGPHRVSAVVAVSPALWNDGADASASGFADTQEYDEFRVTGRQDHLAGIPVRVDCGTGDPFYGAVHDYVEGFPAAARVRSSFEPGAHTDGYWRRMLPRDLAFLGRHASA